MLSFMPATRFAGSVGLYAMFVSAWRRYVQSWLTRTSRRPARSLQPSDSTLAPTGCVALEAVALVRCLDCSMVLRTPPEKNGIRLICPFLRWITAGFNWPAAISFGITGWDFEDAPGTATTRPTKTANARKQMRIRIVLTPLEGVTVENAASPPAVGRPAQDAIHLPPMEPRASIAPRTRDEKAPAGAARTARHRRAERRRAGDRPPA